MAVSKRDPKIVVPRIRLALSSLTVVSLGFILTACERPGFPDPSASATPIPLPTVSATPTPPATPTGTPTAEPSVSPTGSAGGQTFHFNLAEEDNMSDEDRVRVLKAGSMIEKIMVTEEFKQKILNYTYAGSKQFVDNDGMSNLQIYNKIMKGRELDSKIDDYSMDLYLGMYYKRNNVVGYGYPGDKWIYFNTYFFDDYSIPEISNTLTHEWLHKVGFDHDFNATARRPYSVPYAVGDLVEELVIRELKKK